MKNIRGIKILLLIIFVFSLFYFDNCYAYQDSDLPYQSNKNYRLTLNDIDSNDIKKLYNPDNTPLPERFSIKEFLKQRYNIDLPVGDQKELGLCDAFASLKAVETNYAIKSGIYVDLSERYVDYMLSKYFYGSRTPGMLSLAINALAQGEDYSGDAIAIDEVYSFLETFGGVTEYEVPYRDYEENEYNTLKNVNTALKLNGTVIFPNLNLAGNTNLNSNLRNRWLNIFKIHLMKYGAIRIAIESPSDRTIYNSQSYGYYNSSTSTNFKEGHGVTIVGWDDNYSKDNFNIKPEHDGAFIVLNSWGDSWGDEGYFYISYDDKTFLMQSVGVLDVSLSRNYNIYTYSEKMFTTTGGIYSSNSIVKKSFGIKFNKEDGIEYLSHITAFIGTIYNKDYTSKINYYLNPVDDSFDKEKMIYLGSTSSIIIGSQTNISLDNPIKLEGNSFSVVFEFACENAKCGWNDSENIDGNQITGNMYNSDGFNGEWKKSNYEFPVFVATVNDKVPTVQLLTPPNKTTYNKNEELDLAGGVLRVSYNNQSDDVPMTSKDVIILNYNSNINGQYNLVVNYDGAITNFDIYINKILSVSVEKLPNKLVYEYGDYLDLSGGLLKINYEDGSTRTISMTSNDIITNGIDYNTYGTQTIFLLYEGKMVYFTITLNKKIIELVKIQVPNKKDYLIGEKLDLTGGYLTIKYNDSSTEDIPLTTSGVTITGFNSNVAGVQTLTVSYKGKSSTFKVTIISPLVNVVVNFDSNGGSNIASQKVNKGGKIVRPQNPVKNGYTFKEWQLKGNVFDFDSPILEDITLIAIWEQNELRLFDILKNNGYLLKDSFVYNFALGDTITSLKNKLGNKVVVESKNAIISTETIFKKGNESYTAVIKGDLNGDGKVNSADLLIMRKYLLEEITLTGAYKLAGIIESKNEIKSLDLLRLRQYLLGEYKFQ